MDDELDAAKFRLDTAEFAQAAASIIGPLWWSLAGSEIGKDRQNGTAFFMRTATRLIGVTAAHVVQGWKRDGERCSVSALSLTGPNSVTMQLNWAQRQVACHTGMDIATFSITEVELGHLGFVALPYEAERYPAEIGEWVTYCGFPGAIRQRPSATVTTFSMCVATGRTTSLHDRKLTIQLERQHLEPMWVGGLPPEGFSFGGMSGGPVLRNFADESGALRAVIGGIISDGRGTVPDGDSVERIEGLELIAASRAEFIKSDGTLDMDKWTALP